MVLSSAKIVPSFGTLATAWRLWNVRRHRLIRDAALWLRAPSGQRPRWLER